MRTALALALLLLVAPSAAAQEKVDLSAAAAYRPAVGDRVRCARRERQVMDTVARQAGQPDQTKHEDTGYEAVWTDEVLEVSDDGRRAARLRRRYESFRDLGRDEAVAAAGVEVLIATDAAGTLDFAPTEESAPLPPALAQALKEELGRASKRAGQPEPAAVLVPSEPQAVGGAWDVDPARLAGSLNVGSPEDLVPERCSVRATLASVEEVDGVRVATITCAVKLAFARLESRVPLAEPAALDLALEVRLPVAGDSPAGSVTSKGTFGAAPAPPELPAGMTMRVDIAMDRAERRERVRP